MTRAMRKDWVAKSRFEEEEEEQKGFAPKFLLTAKVENLLSINLPGCTPTA